MENLSVTSCKNSDQLEDQFVVQEDVCPENSGIDFFELKIDHLKRDDEDHVILHAQHRELHWCNVGVRIISRPNQASEIQSSFGIDHIDYALEEDFKPQKEIVAAISDAIATYSSAKNAAGVLNQDLEASFERIRKRWAENAAKGYSIERFSFYKNYDPILVIAAPSTALGKYDIVGAQQNYDKTKFEAYSAISQNNPKRLVAITQKLLKDSNQFSGHEKLQLLSGEETKQFTEAREVFLESRLRSESSKQHCLGIPGTCATAWQDETYGKWRSGTVKFQDGGHFSLTCSNDNQKDHRDDDLYYLSVHSHIAGKKLNLNSNWRNHDNPFYIKGGVGAKDRFPSIADMDLSFSTLFERLLALDPVWPEWVYAKCNVPFDSKHPTLEHLVIPPRHQPVVAMMLDQSYDEQKKFTERFVQRKQKMAAKVEAVSEQPKELPDGTIFGNIINATLETWNNERTFWNARIFTALTTSEKDAKRQSRALVPLTGAMNPRPLTPKHLAKLKPYKQVDALRLFPDIVLGDDSRDLIEAAFRVTFELIDTTENPLLSGGHTISFIETNEQGIRVRWTKFDDEDGYSLLSFSIVNTEKSPHPLDFSDELSAGLGVLTTPRGRQVYFRPPFVKSGNHLPKREFDGLKQAIGQALSFEPSKAEEVIHYLENEWESHSKKP